MRKGQGRKLSWTNRDLRSLRQHCIKNRHSSISDITTWAQDYFGKPLSSTTIRSYIHKCQLKLYCAKRKPYVNSVQKRRRLLWARRHLGWTITQWKRVLWSDESVFQVFFGRNGRRVLRTKEEKDHPDCYQQQVQKPGSVMVWGCVSALGKGNLHFCDGTINAEKYIEILEHNMLPSRRHLFQGRPCIFQQDNAKPHSAHIKAKSWLRRKRVRVLDWPACSPDLSPIENVWRILKRKMRQRRPRTVAHLKTCLQEEWDKITPETLHHLVSSVPKRLLSVVKRMATLQSGKCFTVPTFFGMCCRSEWQERMYIYKWHEVDQTKHEIFCSYCLQWNTSQSKFRNHYFLFLFAFSILSQLFLIWGCIYIYIYMYVYIICVSIYLSHLL